MLTSLIHELNNFSRLFKCLQALRLTSNVNSSETGLIYNIFVVHIWQLYTILTYATSTASLTATAYHFNSLTPHYSTYTTNCYYSLHYPTNRNFFTKHYHCWNYYLTYCYSLPYCLTLYVLLILSFYLTLL